MRTMLLAAVLLLAVAAAPASGPIPLDDVGNGPAARLTMRFKVSFLRIDIADVEALLPADAAAKLATVAAEGARDEDTRREMERIAVAADPVVFRMTFVRDAGLDRVLTGNRRNLEAARDAGFLTAEEFDAVWASMQEGFSVVGDRGVRKGDSLLYRADADLVSMEVRGAGGETVHRFDRTGGVWGRAVRGAFLSSRSRFSEGLFRSVRSGD